MKLLRKLRKLATASPPLVIRRASGGQAESGMVVEDVQDLHLGAVGQPPMGDVGLPAFVGLIGTNIFHDERGRFCGGGGTKPRRDKIRQIVETAGTGSTAAVAAR
jgi:hypothetical protein